MSEVAIVDLRYLAESQPSLCIPRVFNNITEARIRQVFDDLGLGKISRIDIKERKNEKGDSFKRVYVHFDKWFWNEDAQAARRKLVSGKEIKIVYDNPWFWKVSASKWAPSGDLQERGPPQRSRAHIDFEDETRSRVTDEFGRDLRVKKEHERRRDDSRERRRPDERRRDDSRERRRPDERRRDERRPDERRRDERRPDERRRDDSRERPARRQEPRDDRRNSKNSRHPIAPTLQRKADKPVEPRTPPSSPPRSRPLVDNPDTLTEQFMVKIDYGNIQPPPLRKRRVVPKKTPELVETVTATKNDDLEDGEVVESGDERYAGMSEADKKACEDLYGDL